MPLAAFHPTVATWFAETLGEPTPPQVRGWPAIRNGEHTLIAAPTGSGKTLAAFLSALDELLRDGAAQPDGELPDETRVLYVSPLKALSNDVQKNLERPLAELRARDDTLPEVRVVVRTGDTPAKVRTAMAKKPPHVLVTTPESLFIVLASESGRALLRTVRTVIVDEIHALAGDKRGSHLALTLERLVALTGRDVQRIGLSATQRPIETVARFLVGQGRGDCTIVDEGHARALDAAVELPASSPLDTICSHETWEEIYGRIVELIEQHTTTLVFTNTRKLAERVAARLTDILGADAVTSHHGSISRERRLDAERRLKNGELKALVATASLELGIDVGDVDLVVQIGTTASIATSLQRIGRAGHAVGLVPKGRLFPLTRDELVTSAGLMLALRRRMLDRVIVPRAPLDILAQHVVAACVADDQDEDALFAMLRRATPYAELERADFDTLVTLHAGEGRHALIHRDGVNRRLRATKRARLPVLTASGAIPDLADYLVVEEPEGTPIGSVSEDLAVESSVGDVFQLGNASWQVLRVQPGKVFVRDAHGVPPTLPFWFGEAPARTDELSDLVSEVRARGLEPGWLEAEADFPAAGAAQIRDFLRETSTDLGCVPTKQRLVLERFFDATGGMQLILHAPFGSRVNRAFGLALRKKFCRGFGFELQAAADEDAILLSLGPMHAFPLDDVWSYLHPNTARDTLVQATLASPVFESRWRWNVTRSLVVPRTQGGKRVPPAILRMRADDALAKAFPEVLACGENLPAGDLPVPDDHPLVRQTVHDCLHEAFDFDGFVALLRAIRAGLDAADDAPTLHAVDVPKPSAMAQSILNAAPYAFLDDAPLEERRTQAVLQQRTVVRDDFDALGALDAAAVERVRDEAWPSADSADEVHEALTWMGFVHEREAAERDSRWTEWLTELTVGGRAQRDERGRWFATEASHEPLAVARGRLEVLGPIAIDADPETFRPDVVGALEAGGEILRVRLPADDSAPERDGICNRRLLARVHRYTLDALRAEIRAVTAADYLHFLSRWQRRADGCQAEGPDGLRDVLAQLSGIEVPAHAWESEVLTPRVHSFAREWLDQLTLTGEVAWCRVWDSGRGTAPAVRNTPMCLVPRIDLPRWLELAAPPRRDALGASAATILDVLEERGATFPTDLEHATRLLPSAFEDGLSELVARGIATCDAFAALRQLTIPPAKRAAHGMPFGIGRWALIRPVPPADGDLADRDDAEPRTFTDEQVDFVLDRLLSRWGVVFKRVLLREKQPIPWRLLLQACHRRELRGELRGGRFVERFDGAQFALPAAVEALRRARRTRPDAEPLDVAAADPLNLRGILTPDARVSPLLLQRVDVVS